MKTFYIVIRGHIGRLLDPSDCTIAKNKNEAIALCKADPDGDTEFLKLRLNKKVSALYIKKIALATIW